ncbi:MAG TPA: GNAT family N-acetyltransferase [Cryomorphaceae bacterium]|nr:GNAT family N-acetyltransferase [Cryomorphaceae bacterium]
MEIKLEKGEKKGSAYFEDDGNRVAEMTFSVASKELIIIDHTYVNENYRDQELGRLLLDVLVQKAREDDFKIMPLCPYAATQFQKDESIRDVMR